MQLLHKKALECFLVVLWNIWNSSNNSICMGKEEDARMI